MEQISERELNERVAILRKFRSLLECQRAKFREYLDVLEKQQNSIVTENPEALLAHTELEQQIVKNISSLQKVIVPMSEIYRSISSENITEEDKSLEAIRSDLSKLQTQVLTQNERNRELLRTHISQIRQQLDQFTNPYRNTKSVYAQKVASGSLVEVEA